MTFQMVIVGVNGATDSQLHLGFELSLFVVFDFYRYTSFCFTLLVEEGDVE